MPYSLLIVETYNQKVVKHKFILFQNIPKIILCRMIRLLYKTVTVQLVHTIIKR